MGTSSSKELNEGQPTIRRVKDRQTLRSMYKPDVLDDAQIEAIVYISEKAHVLQESAYKSLLRKLHKKQYVETLLHYVEYECPMIIHFKLDKLPIMMNDTHYRNGHETGCMYGTATTDIRRATETLMFSGASNYLRCDAVKLPKYGVMDLYNQRSPLQSCSGYGKGIFILSSDIRSRVTLTNGDSLNMTMLNMSNVMISTCDQAAHLLDSFKLEKLTRLLQCVKGKSLFRYQSLSLQYREIQIHGMVEFGKDIVELRVPAYCKQKKIASKFVDKFNMKLSFY